MDATSTASVLSVVTPTSAISTAFVANSFEFWSAIVGVMSAIFGFILSVFAFVLGLQIWQQIKLRDKAEKEYEAIKKVAKDMVDLRDQHKKLLGTLVETAEDQVKQVAGKAQEITKIKNVSQETKQRIEKITKEIEAKAEDLRGSVIKLGNVSSLGTISGPTLSGMEHYTRTYPLTAGSEVQGKKIKLDDFNFTKLSEYMPKVSYDEE